METQRDLGRAEVTLRNLALAYPGAYEEFPWGHRAIKVKGKAFLFMAAENNELSLSVKLPTSCLGALMLPFASATGYGLGRSGWVTARFGRGESVPVGLLGSWLDESYRAIAPKALVARLPGSIRTPARPATGDAPRPRRVARRAPRRARRETIIPSRARSEEAGRPRGRRRG